MVLKVLFILILACLSPGPASAGSVRTFRPAFQPFFEPKVTKSGLALRARSENAECVEVLLGRGQDAEVFAQVRRQSGGYAARARKRYFVTDRKDGFFEAEVDTETLVAAQKDLSEILKPFRVIDVHDLSDNFVELELLEGETLYNLMKQFGPDDRRIQALVGRYNVALQEVTARANAAGHRTMWLIDGPSVEGIGIDFEHKDQEFQLLIHWMNIVVDYKTGEFIINDPK